MRQTLLALLAIAAGAGPALAASDADLSQAIVGRWSQNPNCQGDIVAFKADGTVSRHHAGDDPSDDKQGTYKIAGGKLTGSLGPDVDLTITGDTLLLIEPGGHNETGYRCAS